MKPVLLFSAPIKTRSGYGEHARDLAYAMITTLTDQYTIQILPTAWGGTPWTGLDMTTAKGITINDYIVTQPPQEQPDIFMQLTIPNEFQPIGKYNIGVTAGIETDLCAPDWIEGCNRMNMLITTSQHSLDVFKNSKYDVHDNTTHMFVKTVELRPDLVTHVLFEGVDLNVFKSLTNEDLTSELYQQISGLSENFAYLFVGHWLEGKLGEDRKDVGMLIHTFATAFENKPPSSRPALILKTSSGTFSIQDRLKLEEKIKQITQQMNAAPSIYLLHGDLSDAEMNILYHHPKVKAMVSFTHGEGFGRPMLEFGVTGKPVIAPNWSGQLDFLSNSRGAVLLPGELTPVHESAANAWLLKESKWFKVFYGYAAQVFNLVFTRYKEYHSVSTAQKEYVKTTLSFEKMAEQLATIVTTVPVATKLSLPTLGQSTSAPELFKLPTLKKI